MAASSSSINFLKRSVSSYAARVSTRRCKFPNQILVRKPPNSGSIWCKYSVGMRLVVDPPEIPTIPAKDPGQVPDINTPIGPITPPEIPTAPAKDPGQLPEIEIIPPMPDLPPEPSEPGRCPEFPRPPLPPPEVPDIPLTPPDLVPPEILPPLHPPVGPEIDPPRPPGIDPPKPPGPGPGPIICISQI